MKGSACPLIVWSIHFSSVQSLSRVRLCDPMCCSTPGLPVHHQLPEFTQTHVHRVGDAIQPSHPLASPSPPAPNPSQHQGLFQWVNSSHEVAKVLEFQLQHQSFQWTPRTELQKYSFKGTQRLAGWHAQVHSEHWIRGFLACALQKQGWLRAEVRSQQERDGEGSSGCEKYCTVSQETQGCAAWLILLWWSWGGLQLSWW